jgi:hypothetical protein
MEPFTIFPDTRILKGKRVSNEFLILGIDAFLDACEYVHRLPYGYNSDRDDLLILFKERMGTCTTKHAVIAALAKELGLPIEKHLGIYAMTEQIVTGTDEILIRFNLPYIPMVHCFLVFESHRVDLTEGNRNGKNRSIDVFFHTEPVKPNISAKEEYLLYRSALKNHIMILEPFHGIEMNRILHARERGLALLKAKIQ